MSETHNHARQSEQLTVLMVNMRSLEANISKHTAVDRHPAQRNASPRHPSPARLHFPPLLYSRYENTTTYSGSVLHKFLP